MWSRARLRLSLTLLFFVAISVPTLSAQSWCNSAWSSRQQITINSFTGTYGLGSDLTKFPFLVQVTGANDLFTKAQTSGNDILFTASDGVTKIPHEIENYSSGSTNLTAWVQLPVFSHTADTVIYMYYGNPTAGSQQQARAVWDTMYESVYHLNESAGSTYTDSTSNANAGLGGGTVSTNQAPTRSTDSITNASGGDTARTSTEPTTTSRCPGTWGSQRTRLSAHG